MKYRIFTVQLRFPYLEEKLKFEIETNLFRESYDYVWDGYAAEQHYGQLARDENRAMAHATRMLQLVAHNIAPDMIATYCNMLIDDLRNLLCCFDYGTPVNKTKTEALIRSMLAVEGYARSIASCILSYYESYSRKVTHENNPVDFVDHYALNFPSLYSKFADHALFLDQDADLAMQFYHLAALNWGDPKETVAVSNVGDWFTEHAMTLILQGGKQIIPPDGSNYQALLNALGNIVDALGNGTNTQIVELADAYFDIYDKAILGANDNIELFRFCIMSAWAAKKYTLLPALCCLHMEPEEVVKQLEPDVTASIAAMRFPDAPTRPLLDYLGIQSSNIWNLLRFACTIDIVRHIQNSLRIKQIKQDTAYYTSLDTLMYMLPARLKDERDWGKFSVMNVAYMNDPNEGRILHKYLQSDHDPNSSDKRKNASPPFVFMKCFTSRIDDLPMWEMYGDRAQGVCIVVDWISTLTSTTPLYRICYLTRYGDTYKLDQSVNQELTNLNSIKSWLDELKNLREAIIDRESKLFFDSLTEGIAYLFKDSSYHYEQEVRILYAYNETTSLFKHTSAEYPKLYVQTEFPVVIKEIIIGPKFKDLALRMPYLREQVERMCRSTDTTHPKITMSNIEYR